MRKSKLEMSKMELEAKLFVAKICGRSSVKLESRKFSEPINLCLPFKLNVYFKNCDFHILEIESEFKNNISFNDCKFKKVYVENTNGSCVWFHSEKTILDIIHIHNVNAFISIKGLRIKEFLGSIDNHIWCEIVTDNSSAQLLNVIGRGNEKSIFCFDGLEIEE